MRGVSPGFLQYTQADSELYLNHSDFKQSPTHRIRLACIMQMLNKAAAPGHGKILEIGCGTGNIATPIASCGYDITAIDIHKPSIIQAQQRNRFENLRFMHAPAETVNIKDYNVIILTEVLEHIKDTHKMLNLLSSSMEPQSTLIITVPNGWGLAEIFCRPSYTLKKWPGGIKIVKTLKHLLKTADTTTSNPGTPHVHFFTLRKLVRSFKKHHLYITEFNRLFCLWPLWETFFSTLLPFVMAGKRFCHITKASALTVCVMGVFSSKKL